jgi:O-methyltransferase
MAEITVNALMHSLRELRGATLVGGDTQYPLSVIIPNALYSPWLIDDAFNRAVGLCAGHTLVDRYRCFELWQLAKYNKIVGDVIEIGVWRGGTGALLALQSPTRQVFLADTFTGVVKAGAEDSGYHGGEHGDTSRAIVTTLLDRIKVNNVTLLQGVFPDETGDQIADRRFSLAHIDVDVYQSAKDVFAWVWPRMTRGGMVVFDDYGFPEMCPGITKLVNEWRDRPDVSFIHNLNGHALLMRIE